MRILVAAVMLFISATIVGFSTRGSLVAAAPGVTLSAGDQLVYDITVELQQHHHAGANTKTPDKSTESAARGTETFSIYAISQDGTAFANVDVSFQGNDNGKPFESHSSTTAKLMPDGRLRVKDQLGLGISDAISFANTTTGELSLHPLRLGSAWTTPQNTPYVRLTLARKVAGMKNYQGFSAYEVQSLGTGELLKTTDGAPATGTVAVSGTCYYDAKDHLIIGEAVRTLTVVQQSASAHDNYSATMNLVLGSWTHGSPAPAASTPQPAGSPQSTTEPQLPSPAPIQSIFGSTPYPTVTPRLDS